MKLFTKDSRIKEAVDYAQKYFNSDDFIRDILSVDRFDSSNVSPAQIVELFAEFTKTGKVIEIKVTYFGWFYRNVLGRTVGNGFAYINTSGLGRTLWAVGATAAHEPCHIVDEFFPKARFGHGSNSSKGKGRTFPYFIDERAEIFIKKEVLKKEINRLSMKIVLLREGVA
jgi:hypothetical protein